MVHALKKGAMKECLNEQALVLDGIPDGFLEPCEVGDQQGPLRHLSFILMEPAMDDRIVAINMEIAQEDITVMERLNPVRTPETLTREVLIASDRPAVRYREFLKGWESRGWRLDLKKMRELRGDVAMAIPCPARRTEKNWVLDEVPRVGRG